MDRNFSMGLMWASCGVETRQDTGKKLVFPVGAFRTLLLASVYCARVRASVVVVMYLLFFGRDIIFYRCFTSGCNKGCSCSCLTLLVGGSQALRPISLATIAALPRCWQSNYFSVPVCETPLSRTLRIFFHTLPKLTRNIDRIFSNAQKLTKFV